MKFDCLCRKKRDNVVSGLWSRKCQNLTCRRRSGLLDQDFHVDFEKATQESRIISDFSSRKDRDSVKRAAVDSPEKKVIEDLGMRIYAK
jgi:hypothetical protein